jgi:hypothetical protein
MISKIYLYCGCIAVDDGDIENVGDSIFSEQCPLHGSASDLLEALELIRRVEVDAKAPEDFHYIESIARGVIKKAGATNE